MDRTIVYPGSLPQDTDILQPQLNAMIAVGRLVRAVFGTGTIAEGLLCTQTTVPGMHINIAPGSIATLLTVDSSSYGSLPSDTADSLMKMGINITDTDIGPFTAPITAGQSQAFLIQAQLSETDTVPVVLPYYNASNPAIPYSGPANSGTPQNTQRTQRVLLQSKAGAAATTGTQVTPTPDAGFVGLYQITIANGATTILNASIVQLPTAPFVDPMRLNRGLQPGRLIGTQVFIASGTYTPTKGMVSVIFEVQGGGGAGGGAGGAASGNVSMGAPGGAGAYAKGLFTATAVGTSKAVTIGAGGTGVSNAAGNNGGVSSVGTLISTPGGIGGGILNNQVPPSVNGNGSATGAPTGGNIFGSQGASSSPSVGYTAALGIGGLGGASMFGSGTATTQINTTGAAATNPGTGGGGCVLNQAGGSAAGGAGFRGIVIATEYS